jgi:hypothetical protein
MMTFQEKSETKSDDIVVLLGMTMKVIMMMTKASGGMSWSQMGVVGSYHEGLRARFKEPEWEMLTLPTKAAA